MEEDLKTQWILMGMILCALLISFALGYYVELEDMQNKLEAVSE